MTLLNTGVDTKMFGAALGGSVGGGLDGNRIRLLDSSFGRATTILTSGVYVLIESDYELDTSLPDAGFSHTAAGRITWDGPGTRMCMVNFCCDVRANGTTEVHVALGRNGTVILETAVHNLVTASRLTMAPIRWVIPLSAGQYVEMFINFITAGPVPLTVGFMQFTVD